MGVRARWFLGALALYAAVGFLAALWHQPYYAVVSLLIVVFASLFFFGDSEYATRLALQPEDRTLLWVIFNPLRWPSMGLRTARSLRSSHEADQYFVILFSWLSVLLLVLPDMYSDISEAQALETVLVAWAPIMLLPGFAQLAWHCWFVRKKERIKGLHFGPYRQSGVIQEQLDLVRQLMHGGIQRRTRLCQACCRLTSRTAARDRRLYDLFESMDGSVLNDVLMGLIHTETPLQHILYVAKNRESLVELLGVRRVHQLSVPAKSMLLNTFMFLRLQSCAALEPAVEALLASTAGDDLSELKSRQDAGNSQSMHKLIFQDIIDLEVRQRLLDHFLSEAQAQVAQRALLRSPHFAELLRMGRARGCVPQHLRFVDQLTAKYQGGTRHAWMKIISDIDDTVECSGNKWPAGIDARYPRHTTYPGVTAFFRELQGGGEVGHLVLLSARPHICGSLMEQRIFKKFAKKGEDSFFCQPAVLPGDLVSGADFVLNGSMQALADRKFRNFEKYFRIYPEFRFVFLGDNGQADYEVGKRMCHEFGRHIEQVWIHRVQPEESTFGYDAEAHAEGALNFFTDYIDAAVHACSRPEPLISLEGLTRVVEGARADFARISWTSEANRERERERLNSSIERANNLLTTLCCQSLPLIEDDPRGEPQFCNSDGGSDCCSDGDHPHAPHAHAGFFDSMWRKVSRAPAAADAEAPSLALEEVEEHIRAQAAAFSMDGVVDKGHHEPGQAPDATRQTADACALPEAQGVPAGAQGPEARPPCEAAEQSADPAVDRRGAGSMLGGIWQSTRTMLHRKPAEEATGSPPPQSRSPTLAPAAGGEGAERSRTQSGQSGQGADAVGEPPEQASTGAEDKEGSTPEQAGKPGGGLDAHRSAEGDLAKAAVAADPSAASSGDACGASGLAEGSAEAAADTSADRRGSMFGGIWQSTRTILQRKVPEDSATSPLLLPAQAPPPPDLPQSKGDAGAAGDLLPSTDTPPAVTPQAVPVANGSQEAPPTGLPEAVPEEILEEAQGAAQEGPGAASSGGSGSRISGIWQSTRSRLRRRSPEDLAAGGPQAGGQGQPPGRSEKPPPNGEGCSDAVGTEASSAPPQPAQAGHTAGSTATGETAQPAGDRSSDAPEPAPSGSVQGAPPPADLHEALPADVSSLLADQAMGLPSDPVADKRGPGSMLGGIWQSTRTILQRKAHEGASPSPALSASPSPAPPSEPLEMLEEVFPSETATDACPEASPAERPAEAPTRREAQQAAGPARGAADRTPERTPPPQEKAGGDAPREARMPSSPSALQWLRAQSSRAGRMTSRPRHDHAHAPPLPPLSSADAAQPQHPEAAPVRPQQEAPAEPRPEAPPQPQQEAPEAAAALGEAAEPRPQEEAACGTPPAAPTSAEQGEQGLDRKGAGSMLGGIWQSTRTILQRKAPEDPAAGSASLPPGHSAEAEQGLEECPQRVDAALGQGTVPPTRHGQKLGAQDAAEAGGGSDAALHAGRAAPSQLPRAARMPSRPRLSQTSSSQSQAKDSGAAPQEQVPIEETAVAEELEGTGQLAAAQAGDPRGRGSMLGGIWQSTRTMLHRRGSEDAATSTRMSSPTAPPARAESDAAGGAEQPSEPASECAEAAAPHASQQPDAASSSSPPKVRADSTGDPDPTSPSDVDSLAAAVNSAINAEDYQCLSPAGESIGDGQLPALQVGQADAPQTEAGSERRSPGSMLGGIWESTRTMLQRRPAAESAATPLRLPSPSPAAESPETAEAIQELFRSDALDGRRAGGGESAGADGPAAQGQTEQAGAGHVAGAEPAAAPEGCAESAASGGGTGEPQDGSPTASRLGDPAVPPLKEESVAELLAEAADGRGRRDGPEVPESAPSPEAPAPPGAGAPVAPPAPAVQDTPASPRGDRPEPESESCGGAVQQQEEKEQEQEMEGTVKPPLGDDGSHEVADQDPLVGPESHPAEQPAGAADSSRGDGPEAHAC